MFSLRHSKEERKDLDWELEEKGRQARREVEERERENNTSDAGKEVYQSPKLPNGTNIHRKTNSSSSHELKKKSLVSVIWWIGFVVEAAPRSTMRKGLRNQKSSQTSARIRCGSTLWMLMRSS